MRNGVRTYIIVGYKNLDILKEELNNCSLRRTKDMLKDLPDKNVITEIIEMKDNHKKFYDAEYVFNSKGIPTCTCGGTVKPDVVLYEEGLDENTLEKSIISIINADLLIVAGTSLTVYPASGLINYFRGKNLVLINRDATPFDNRANLVLNETLGRVFKEIEV